MHTTKKARLRPSGVVNFSRETAPPERWQHPVEFETSTVGDTMHVQRSRSGLTQLHQSNKIGQAEVWAAERWYGDWALGAQGARNPEKSGSGGGHDAFPCAKVDALTRYREASQATGLWGDGLMQMFVAQGMSFRGMAEKLGMDNRDLTGQVVATLIRLREHYAEIDNRRERLPSYEFSRVRNERRAAV